jgi:hypothetical protein
MSTPIAPSTLVLVRHASPRSRCSRTSAWSTASTTAGASTAWLSCSRGSGGAGASLSHGAIRLHISCSPVPSSDDLWEPAVQAHTVIAVWTARGRIGSAKLDHQRPRCSAERGDGRFGWCRFGSRQRGTKTLQRTSISRCRPSHLHPSGPWMGSSVKARSSLSRRWLSIWIFLHLCRVERTVTTVRHCPLRPVLALGDGPATVLGSLARRDHGSCGCAGDRPSDRAAGAAVGC